MRPDDDTLQGIDAEIARAWTAWRRWKGALAKDPKSHGDEDPLASFHRVAGKLAYEALGERVVFATDEAWRGALRRWVHALTRRRVTRELDAEWALVAVEESARLDLDPPRMVSWQQAWRELVRAKDHGARLAWLAAAAERGPSMAAVAAERAARTAEVARRLGIDDLSAFTTGVPEAALERAAKELLAKTADLAEAMRRETTRAAGHADASVASILASATARDAQEGWPARLTTRWLHDLFGSLARGLDLELTLPSSVGASSFARALERFGYALRVAGPSRALPFALARDPDSVDAHRFGLAFGSLATSARFQRKALGLGAKVADAQTRMLAGTALLEARTAAVRVLLTNEASHAPADRFEELTAALFGAPLTPSLRGAWPPPTDDARARFAALASVLPFVESLVDRFDDDWFRNPRAAQHLRALASAPAKRDDEPSLDPVLAAEALARAFEQVLG